jgi:hypothetical protein
MKSLICTFGFILALTLLLSCGSGGKPVNSDELVGDWYTVKGDIEAYSLMKDNNDFYFTGTLNDRPVVQGTWKIDGSDFVLAMDNGTTTRYSFRLLHDTLILNNGEEIYTRTEPLYVSHPEMRILEKLNSDLDFDFSDAEETRVDWLDKTLDGYSISTGSTLGSGDDKIIADYLLSEGFIADTLYVTDICNGYRTDYASGEIVVTVCTHYDMDITDDKTLIVVSSAFLK